MSREESSRQPDPEFVAYEDQEDPPTTVGLKQKINLLGILRLLLGQVRDSSGRPNNILGLLYAYMIFFCAAVWWVTHPAMMRYEVTVRCPVVGKRVPAPDPILPGTPKTTSTVDAKVTPLKNEQKVVKKPSGLLGLLTPGTKQTQAVLVKSDCSGATLSPQINLPPSPPFPASFYWVLLVPFCALLVAYLARHPKMRAFLVNLLLAYRAVRPNGERASQSWKDDLLNAFAGKTEEQATETPKEREQVER